MLIFNILDLFHNFYGQTYIKILKHLILRLKFLVEDSE